MAKTALGMSKTTMVQILSRGAALFGVLALLAPRAMQRAYGVPASAHTAQTLRLFGTRTLALAAWGSTVRTKEETDRALAVAAGVNLLDVLTALASARGTGRATAVPAVLTSGTFAAIALAARSLED